MMLHENLANHYRTNFALMQHHKYSLTELDNMIPFERQAYVAMLIQYLEEEDMKRKQNRFFHSITRGLKVYDFPV